MALSSAVDLNAIARVVGIKTIFRDLRAGQVQFLPQRVNIIGQGNKASVFPLTKQVITSALQAAEIYGFGSPVHESAKQLLPINGDGVGTIPVTIIPVGAGPAAAATVKTIIATGTSTRQFTGRVRVGDVLSNEFVIPDATVDTAVGAILEAAINAVLDVPMDATSLTDTTTLTAKWDGETGNGIQVEMIDTPTDAGITFAVATLTPGAVNPDVSTALAQIGDVWESLIINAASLYDDTVTLDVYSTYGEGRWDPLVRKPLTVYSATPETTIGTLTAFGDGRRLDRTNIVLSMPGCKSTPWAMAARAVARIVVIADAKPANDYARQVLSGLIPGTDAEQWDYTQRDLLVKSGIGTTQIRDGVINTSDTVTYYHPTGDAIPAYRFLKTIVKLQQVIFNTDLIFNSAEWDGAPLIPDEDPTTNREAKKPKTAVAAVNVMIDNLGLEAILSNPAESKLKTVAQISETNPDRLDLSMCVFVSGNVNISSNDLNFGFFFGQSTIIA